MKEIALVTGASEGIGLEFATQLAKKKVDVVITARNLEKLNLLKLKLEQLYAVSVYVIPKDLSQIGSAKELYDEIQKLNLQVSVLINNAGFGIYGKFLESDLEKELEMIQLNITSLTILTKLFSKDMVTANYGRIMNVASAFSFIPAPLFSVYAATKAYVLSFSEALNNELKDSKVTITCYCPGATATKFSKENDMAQSNVYQILSVAEPAEVARVGLNGMIDGKRTFLYGFKNKVLIFTTRLASRGLVLKISSLITQKK